MDDNRNTYKIKSPSGASTIISTMISMGTMIVITFITSNDEVPSLLIAATVVCLLFCLALLVLTLYRATRKPADLEIHENTLKVNGRIVEPQQIGIIMVRGYFWPAVGIKPKHNKIVPHYYFFKIMHDEDQAIRELAVWAEKNQVQFARKSFTTWV